MDFNQIIHAWERKDLPTELEEIQDVQRTILNQEAECKKWEAEAISKQVKSLYNFNIGFCAVINADVERIIQAAIEYDNNQDSETEK